MLRSSIRKLFKPTIQRRFFTSPQLHFFIGLVRWFGRLFHRFSLLLSDDLIFHRFSFSLLLLDGLIFHRFSSLFSDGLIFLHFSLLLSDGLIFHRSSLLLSDGLIFYRLAKSSKNEDRAKLDEILLLARLVRATTSRPYIPTKEGIALPKIKLFYSH